LQSFSLLIVQKIIAARGFLIFLFLLFFSILAYFAVLLTLPIIVLVFYEISLSFFTSIAKLLVFLQHLFADYLPSVLDFLALLSPKYTFDQTTRIGYTRAVIWGLIDYYNSF